MWFRDVGRSVDAIDLSNTVVLSNEYHFRKLASIRVGHGCVLSDDSEQARPDFIRMKRLVFVDSRLDVIAATVTELSDLWLVRPDVTISVLMPSRQFQPFVRYLQTKPIGEKIALTEYSYDGDCVCLGFRAAVSSDRPIGDFLMGYALTLGDAESSPDAAEADCGNCDVNERKLLSSLQTIEAISQSLPTPQAVRTSTESAVALLESAQSTVARLEDDLLEEKRRGGKLEASLTEVQDKYRALSSSYLGSMTLRYWSWRQKGGRRENR